MFQTNTGRAIHKWEHYFPAYEELLLSWRNQTLFLLEIGCGSGGSLHMWRRYLGPLAQIVGIDIDPKCKAYECNGIHVRIGNQSDTNFLDSIIKEFGAPNIVIDDGSHMMIDINSTFDFLYPIMPPNSIYIVEDLHTAYWEEYGGGIGRQDSFVNRAKSFIDQLNADHSRGQVPVTNFTKQTYSMHIYDSIIAFKKGRILHKNAPMIGSQF